MQFKELSKNLKGWGYLAMTPGQARSFFAPVIPKDFVPFKYFDELGQQYPASPVEPMGGIKEFLDSKNAKYIELNV